MPTTKKTAKKAAARAPRNAHIAEPLRRLAVKVESLSLDPRNARTHGTKNLAAIRASLERFGQRQPLVVSKDGVVIAGNGRLEAAREMGWTHIAVVRVEDTHAEASAYAIADNRTSDLAGWDDGVLAEILEELRDEDAELAAATGYSERDIDRMLRVRSRSAAEVSEAEPGGLPAKPETRVGDLWTMGRHRLLCGDSTRDIPLVMAPESASAVITDPPYGVDYTGKTEEAKKIRNDGKADLRPILEAALPAALERTKPGGAWYVFSPAGPNFAVFSDVITGLGVWRQTLIWVKDSMVLGRSDYHYRHEPIFYGWAPGASHRAPDDRKQTTVLEFDRPKKSREHPTMKPVALVAQLIENSTDEGALILDPFAGSGTTLIAAEQMGRACTAIELEPAYCDVIVRRWEGLTGEKAARVDAEGNEAPEMPDTP